MKCPICGGETKKKRSIHGGEMIEDFICESCSIAWYVDTGRPRIRISTTHSIASKMDDEEFKGLLRKIEEYEKKIRALR